MAAAQRRDFLLNAWLRSLGSQRGGSSAPLAAKRHQACYNPHNPLILGEMTMAGKLFQGPGPLALEFTAVAAAEDGFNLQVSDPGAFPGGLNAIMPPGHELVFRINGRLIEISWRPITPAS
jgi:hypothetical protein